MLFLFGQNLNAMTSQKASTVGADIAKAISSSARSSTSGSGVEYAQYQTMPGVYFQTSGARTVIMYGQPMSGMQDYRLSSFTMGQDPSVAARFQSSLTVVDEVPVRNFTSEHEFKVGELVGVPSPFVPATTGDVHIENSFLGEQYHYHFE